jgi:hypothetical protein
MIFNKYGFLFDLLQNFSLNGFQTFLAEIPDDCLLNCVYSSMYKKTHPLASVPGKLPALRARLFLLHISFGVV